MFNTEDAIKKGLQVASDISDDAHIVDWCYVEINQKVIQPNWSVDIEKSLHFIQTNASENAWMTKIRVTLKLAWSGLIILCQAVMARKQGAIVVVEHAAINCAFYCHPRFSAHCNYSRTEIDNDIFQRFHIRRAKDRRRNKQFCLRLSPLSCVIIHVFITTFHLSFSQVGDVRQFCSQMKI